MGQNSIELCSPGKPLFCIRCAPSICDTGDGLISVSIQANSSVRPVDDPLCRPDTTTSGGYIPGVGGLSVSITAYAFSPGEDKWLNSRGRGSASASQSNLLRYDFKTDKFWFIPTKSHRAQIIGCIGNVSLGQVLFEGAQQESQITNGIGLTTELSVQIGAELHYTGKPQEVTIPDLQSWQLNIGNGAQTGYISSFNASVDFPNPATVTYTFDFPLDNS